MVKTVVCEYVKVRIVMDVPSLLTGDADDSWCRLALKASGCDIMLHMLGCVYARILVCKRL